MHASISSPEMSLCLARLRAREAAVCLKSVRPSIRAVKAARNIIETIRRAVPTDFAPCAAAEMPQRCAKAIGSLAPRRMPDDFWGDRMRTLFSSSSADCRLTSFPHKHRPRWFVRRDRTAAGPIVAAARPDHAASPVSGCSVPFERYAGRPVRAKLRCRAGGGRAFARKRRAAVPLARVPAKWPPVRRQGHAPRVECGTAQERKSWLTTGRRAGFAGSCAAC